MDSRSAKEAGVPNTVKGWLNSPDGYLVGIARCGALGFSVLCLAWVCWHAFYAIPSADDFCFGDLVSKKGIWGTVEHFYLTWTGRYSSSLLIATFAGSHELLTRQYFLVPLTILVSVFISARHFLKSLGIDDRSYLIVFFGILIATFSFRETVFWLAGGFSYGLACAIFLLLVAEELRIFLSNLCPTWKRVSVLCAATLLLAGFNETIMVAHIAFLLPLFVSCVIKKKEATCIKALTLILVCAITGALIVKFAPGNSVRAANFPNADLIFAIKNSLNWAVQKYWKLFLVSLLLFYSSLIVVAPSVKKQIPSIYVIEFFLFLSFALWGAIFTRAYAVNNMGPVRAQTVDFMLVTVMAFCLAWPLYAGDRIKIIQARKILPLLTLFAGIFVFTSVGRVGADGVSLITVLADMRHGRPLKDYMTARFARAEQTTETKLEFLDYVDKRRSVIFFDDIQEDPADWRNTCFAGYFGLEEVRLKKTDQDPANPSTSVRQ